MNYREALAYIESLSGYGISPGLDSVRTLCGNLGNPQDTQRFIHIAGTNGKGSTLAFVSAILKNAGYRVGRYLSPTLFHYRERIQAGGRPISQAALCEGLELVKAACGRMTAEGLPHPTPFEVETALAFWYFQRQKCDIVVLETGMGGTGDATNIVSTTIAAVITSVSMDHMRFLGDTLEKIALQKAGIIKNNCYVVTVPQKPGVMQVLTACAGEKRCPLILADAERAKRVRYGIERQRFDYGGYRDLEITLAGRYQVENAVLAVETVRTLEQAGFPVKEQALRRGLREAEWPGRFQVIGKRPLFVVDGAHNEDAALRLTQSLEFYFTNRRIIYIIGMLKDKEWDKVIGLTYRLAEQIITVTPPDNPRAMLAYELAGEALKVHASVTAAGSLEEAVEMAYLLAGRDGVIVAFGSLSYLGNLISIVKERNSTRAEGRQRTHNGGSGENKAGGEASAGGNR